MVRSDQPQYRKSGTRASFFCVSAIEPGAVIHGQNGDQPVTAGVFLDAVFSVSTSRSTIED
jgi:hypothetical protein